MSVNISGCLVLAAVIYLAPAMVLKSECSRELAFRCQRRESRRDWTDSNRSARYTHVHAFDRRRATQTVGIGYSRERVTEEPKRLAKGLPTYDFQTPASRPLEFVNAATYTGDPTVKTHQSTREWILALSTILAALIEAGLIIEMFREHEVLLWQGLKNLVHTSDRLWRLSR